jgi:hypothetical protein
VDRLVTDPIRPLQTPSSVADHFWRLFFSPFAMMAIRFIHASFALFSRFNPYQKSKFEIWNQFSLFEPDLALALSHKKEQIS